ncbi:M23 family metallopeptidase [Spongiivirga sp. MCCC 1A20706]|uniref:M23 family metallopeptidase n=1 Tax=Spongiivirga sp. MCCC 1A20706 TaxID=3160963 RepID=UPI003977908F
MKNLICCFIGILFASSMNAQSVSLLKKYENDSVYLSLKSNYPCNVTYVYSLKDAYKGKLRLAGEIVVPANDTLFDAAVVPLSLVKDTASMRLADYANGKGYLGNLGDEHDDSYRYHFPFPTGKRYKIIQSFNGSFSHYEKHSKYAIDFNLKVGDTVTAARGGVVVRVKEDSKEYGGREYVDKGNRIVIMHNDGTMGDYVHLDYNGALVKVGDTIKVDQPIGISGLTGFTTGPHLHFVVMKPGSISVPIYFKGLGKKKLRKGKYYRRARPTKDHNKK